MSVYKNVAKIRQAKGITKTAVAKSSGNEFTRISVFRKRRSRLDVERLKLIAKKLGVNCFVFFDDKLTNSVIKE